MIIAPAILGGLFDVGLKLVDRFFPDPKDAAAAKLELFKMQQTGELAQLAADTSLAQGQLAVNTEEAKSTNVFVSGWRPFIGWTCGVAFCFKYIGGPLLVMAGQIAQITITLPVIETGELMPILFGMLGLGAMRTVEKIKGVS